MPRKKNDLSRSQRVEVRDMWIQLLDRGQKTVDLAGGIAPVGQDLDQPLPFLNGVFLSVVIFGRDAFFEKKPQRFFRESGRGSACQDAHAENKEINTFHCRAFTSGSVVADGQFHQWIQGTSKKV